MPVENFNDYRLVEGDPKLDETRFSVRWGVEQPWDALVEVANIPLDRSGINRLIRVLRTARDKAYGRDE